MLEKIKELLEINSTEKDNEIALYIEMMQGTILDITGLKKLNRALESFVITKIYEVMKSKVIGPNQSQNNKEVASVKRGDTTITYNTSSKVSVTSSDLGLSQQELSFVKQFRKLRCF